MTHFATRARARRRPPPPPSVRRPSGSAPALVPSLPAAAPCPRPVDGAAVVPGEYRLPRSTRPPSLRPSVPPSLSPPPLLFQSAVLSVVPQLELLRPSVRQSLGGVRSVKLEVVGGRRMRGGGLSEWMIVRN